MPSLWFAAVFTIAFLPVLPLLCADTGRICGEIADTLTGHMRTVQTDVA